MLPRFRRTRHLLAQLLRRLEPMPHHPLVRQWCATTMRRGKGDHRHVEGREQRYKFLTVEQLMTDFVTDVHRVRASYEQESSCACRHN